MHHISCRDFWQNIKNHPGDEAPQQPRFGGLWLLAFSKTKITLEKEEISDHWWDSGKYDGAADGDWENCVRSYRAYFEGDWGMIVLCTMFLVSCIFFNKCLFFSYYIVGYFLDSIIWLGKCSFTEPMSLCTAHAVWFLLVEITSDRNYILNSLVGLSVSDCFASVIITFSHI